MASHPVWLKLFIKLIHTVTELCQHWLTLVLTALQGLTCSVISPALGFPGK